MLSFREFVEKHAREGHDLNATKVAYLESLLWTCQGGIFNKGASPPPGARCLLCDDPEPTCSTEDCDWSKGEVPGGAEIWAYAQDARTPSRPFCRKGERLRKEAYSRLITSLLPETEQLRKEQGIARSFDEGAERTINLPTPWGEYELGIIRLPETLQWRPVGRPLWKNASTPYDGRGEPVRFFSGSVYISPKTWEGKSLPKLSRTGIVLEGKTLFSQPQEKFWGFEVSCRFGQESETYSWEIQVFGGGTANFSLVRRGALIPWGIRQGDVRFVAVETSGEGEDSPPWRFERHLPENIKGKIVPGRRGGESFTFLVETLTAVSHPNHPTIILHPGWWRIEDVGGQTDYVPLRQEGGD